MAPKRHFANSSHLLKIIENSENQKNSEENEYEVNIENQDNLENLENFINNNTKNNNTQLVILYFILPKIQNFTLKRLKNLLKPFNVNTSSIHHNIQHAHFPNLFIYPIQVKIENVDNIISNLNLKYFSHGYYIQIFRKDEFKLTIPLELKNESFQSLYTIRLINIISQIIINIIIPSNNFNHDLNYQWHKAIKFENYLRNKYAFQENFAFLFPAHHSHNLYKSTIKKILFIKFHSDPSSILLKKFSKFFDQNVYNNDLQHKSSYKYSSNIIWPPVSIKNKNDHFYLGPILSRTLVLLFLSASSYNNSTVLSITSFVHFIHSLPISSTSEIASYILSVFKSIDIISSLTNSSNYQKENLDSTLNIFLPLSALLNSNSPIAYKLRSILCSKANLIFYSFNRKNPPTLSTIDFAKFIDSQGWFNNSVEKIVLGNFIDGTPLSPKTMSLYE